MSLRIDVLGFEHARIAPADHVDHSRSDHTDSSHIDMRGWDDVDPDSVIEQAHDRVRELALVEHGARSFGHVHGL